MRKFWGWLLAWARISGQEVCRRSRGMGLADYHDYPDGVYGQPWHFYTHRCKRCGKDFTI